MTRSLKAKTTAGLGVLSMLLGALMVFAPAASGSDDPAVEPYTGHPTCTGAGFDHDFGLVADPVDTSGNPTTIDDGEITVTYSTRIADLAGTDTLFIDWTSDAVPADSDGFVLTVLVTQGDGGASFSYAAPGATSGTAHVVPAGNASATGISQLSFCHEGATITPVSNDPTTTSTTEGATTTSEDVLNTTSTTEGATTTTEDVEATTTTAEGVLGTTSTVAETTTTGDDGENSASSTTEGPEVLNNAVGGTGLARTGDGSDRIAAIGAALMILGAILVGGSRRSLIGEG